MHFRDLNAQYKRLKVEIDAGISQVIESSGYILGREVQQLEDRLADYVGVKHCVSCANGTDALQLVMMAWEIGPGDAVFTSDFTFIASAGTVSILGATPILVDIDLDTYNISPDALEVAIERVLKEGRLKPKAIMPVDLFGQLADYPHLEEIAARYGLRVLEDGAQGFGATLNGRRACSFGDAATTSFFPSKPLGCYGDGGAIFTDDDVLDTQLRSLRSQGRSPEDKYDNRSIGINSRLDSLQAAILLPKLHALEDYELDAVNQVATWYTERLKDVVVTPTIPDGYYSSWAQYSILLKDRQSRDSLKAHLAEKGIPTMIYYPRGLHQQEVYAGMNLKDDLFPNTVTATQRILSLPMHPDLSEKDISMISEAIIHTLRHK